MTNDQLYQAIFHRKSIRKYDITPLPVTALSQLQKFVTESKALDEDIKCEFSYLSVADVKNLLPIKAPHYICLYSEKKGNYLMNAGFLMQQIALYLSYNELGSCWLGMAKPSKRVSELKNGLEFVIMLAFGKTIQPVHRSDSSEFNRKAISAISEISGADEILEPVRLAPSSSNSQPWVFSGSTNEIIVSREKLSFIKAPFFDRINQIDIGIALYHLWLTISHLDKNVVFNFEKAPAPNGYEFMAKAKIVKK